MKSKRGWRVCPRVCAVGRQEGTRADSQAIWFVFLWTREDLEACLHFFFFFFPAQVQAAQQLPWAPHKPGTSPAKTKVPPAIRSRKPRPFPFFPNSPSPCPPEFPTGSREACKCRCLQPHGAHSWPEPGRGKGRGESRCCQHPTRSLELARVAGCYPGKWPGPASNPTPCWEEGEF